MNSLNAFINSPNQICNIGLITFSSTKYKHRISFHRLLLFANAVLKKRTQKNANGL